MVTRSEECDPTGGAVVTSSFSENKTPKSQDKLCDLDRTLHVLRNISALNQARFCHVLGTIKSPNKGI